MRDGLRPMPVVSEKDVAFWMHVRNGELKGQKCRSCGAVRLLPAKDCSACSSTGYDEIKLSGDGVVLGACRFHRSYFKELADALPYAVVLVQLQEGPLLYSNLVDEPEALPAPGARVSAVLKPLGKDAGLILFAPVTV